MLIKTIKNSKIAGIFGLSILCSTGFASGVGTTTITKVLAGPNFGNKVFVEVATRPVSVPDCQTNSWWSYVFDATTEAGQATLSIVLLAYASKTTVDIGGTDACSLYTNVESLGHIYVK
jgi:hypothetical protein